MTKEQMQLQGLLRLLSEYFSLFIRHIDRDCKHYKMNYQLPCLGNNHTPGTTHQNGIWRSCFLVQLYRPSGTIYQPQSSSPTQDTSVYCSF